MWITCGLCGLKGIIMGIDLHLHSNRSDGTDEPEEIINIASGLGLKAVSLTDHDTVDGIEKALDAANKKGVGFIPGVEVSAEHTGELHILGYFPDDSYMGINDVLDKMKDARDIRNRKIIDSLSRVRVDISMDEVLKIANGGVAGKPHIASVLCDKGYAVSISDAFDKYLARGRFAYVEKEKFTPERCIEEILKYRGVPVLAHPILLKMNDFELDTFIKRLKEYGLMGIEVYYSLNYPAFTDFSLKIAGKYDLLPTGGSDYHGDNKPDIIPGKGTGDLNVPYEVYERLKELVT